MRPKKQPWTLQEKELIKNFISDAEDRDISIKDVAELLPHRSFTCVKQQIYVMGLQVVGHKNWTSEEDAIIREYYIAKNARDVAALLPGRNLNAVKARANLMGIKKKVIYEKDANFFDVPNITNCAIAGFIAADGNLREDDKRLTINISIKDLEFLKTISKITKFNGKISFQNLNRKKYISATTGSVISEGVSKMCAICVNCEKWHDDLVKHWNITPRKTATLLPPNLTDNKLKMAFISGAICGDGWICQSVSDSGYFTYGVGITGTKELLEWIKITFESLIPNMDAKQLIDNGSPNCRDYCIWGATFYWLAKLFLSLDIPRLDRKWDLAREYISLVESGGISEKMKTHIEKKRPKDEVLAEFGLL